MRKLVGITFALAAVMIGSASAQDRVEGGAPAAALGLNTDPLVQVYRFSGVMDNGGAANTGVATSFTCTNFSGATEAIRVQVRQYDGTVKGDTTFNIPHNVTFTTSTHGTVAFFDDFVLSTGLVNQGSGRIWATSQWVVCNASTGDAASGVPTGVALHGIRFNPIPGTEY